MTDRYNALTVVLAEDVRSDDAEALINAIKQLRGVLSVDGNVNGIEHHIAYERARLRLSDELWKVLHP